MFIGDITDGINFGSLTISDLDYDDKGVYTCDVTNENGTSTDKAMLEIQGMKINLEGNTNSPDNFDVEVSISDTSYYYFFYMPLMNI